MATVFGKRTIVGRDLYEFLCEQVGELDGLEQLELGQYLTGGTPWDELPEKYRALLGTVRSKLR